MKLHLQELCTVHTRLSGYVVDYARYGGVALQRSGHSSPVGVETDHDGVSATAEIDWLAQDWALLDVSDTNRVTEDGAEAVALSYVHSKSGWVVKRRLQRRESADWLLSLNSRWLALEVSGMATGYAHDRLREKCTQLSRCSLPAERLAVVVLFANAFHTGGERVTKTVLSSLAEEELDTLVSIAIRRAEILEDAQSPAANSAWREVMLYEAQLATISSPAEIQGGIARVGAVASALAAGERAEAESLAVRYKAEESLPQERHQAISRAFEEDEQRLAHCFPALAKCGRLAELREWRVRASKGARVFPRAA